MDHKERYGVFVFKDGAWSEMPCKKVTGEEAADLLNLFVDPLLFIYWDHETQSHLAETPLLEALGLPEATW